MQFAARWPDGSVQTYYSPSLVVREYLEPGAAYALPDFLERVRTALRIASERVERKYGFACSRAAATLAQIESHAHRFADAADPTVRIEAYRDLFNTAGSASSGGGITS
jgi:uncharacterized repeat protein (TIGR04042 family)